MKNSLSILTVITIVFILILFHVQTLSAFPTREYTQNFFFNSNKSISTEELKRREVLTRQLKGGQKQLFLFRAKTGECLRFLVEQNGIDVMITIKNAAEKSIKEVDRPSGAFGRETVTFFVPETSVYTIEINTWNKHASPGSYRINYTEIAIPTELDRKRSLAENLTSEGESLRGSKLEASKKQALQKFSQALKIWEELNDIYEQAVVYYGMGFTAQELSDYYDAAIFYSRALKLMTNIGDEFGQAVNHAALGSVENVLSEYELSIYNYKKAIEIYKKLGNSRNLGIAYAGLGAAESLLGENDDAIISLMESLRWRALVNDKSGSALTRFTLTKIYLNQKSFVRAELQLKEAEKDLSSINVSNDAEFFFYSGQLYLETGKYEQARKNLEKALTISRDAGVKLGEAKTLLELSRAKIKSGQLDEAMQDMQTSIDLIERLRKSMLDIRLRIKFTATVQPFYDQYISLLMQMSERDPKKDFEQKALEVSEYTKMRGLLDQMERRRLLRGNKVNPNLLERGYRLRDELTAVLSIQSRDKPTQIAAKIQDISTRFWEVEKETSTYFNTSDNISLPQESISNIRQHLDAESVLLEYKLVENKSFLWIVSNQSIKSFQLPDAKNIEDSARAVYDCISHPLTPQDEKKCHQKLRTLSRILIAPIASEIKGKRLIVVKDGFLQYIPFNALLNPNNQTYLIETNEIVSIPSAAVLNFLREESRSDASGKDVAIFADPIYSISDERITNKKNVRGFLDKKTNLPRLFSSLFEARRIGDLVSPSNLVLRTGSEATTINLLKMNLEDYKVIHFAAHTSIDDYHPELSAIALSFFDENGNSVDGFLRENSVLRLNLNADLVVLSACNSGLGKQVEGEGIVSLANSFFASGTRRLVVSLWNVDDKVTAELMTRFYRKYLKENKTVASALREAQIEILHDKRWHSPFYWSTFVIQGDWK